MNDEIEAVLKKHEHRDITEVQKLLETELDHQDFFYFRKNESNGQYLYHCFPKINTKLIEKSKLMKIYDRTNYVQKVLEL